MISAKVQALVRTRAQERCEYCRLPQAAIELTFHVEHVLAQQHLHDDTPDNLALACHRCNLIKGPNLSSIDPLTDEIVVLFHPRRQLWTEHFELLGDEIVGKTACGRATVSLLQLNSAPRRELRAAIIVAEEW